MEEQVNLRQQECLELQSQLLLFHQTQLEEYQQGLDQIRQLLEAGGGFHAQAMSAKVSMVLTVLEQQMKTTLTTLFEESSQCFETMIERILAEDTAY